MGEARMDLPPSARGPNSIRPWNQPITVVRLRAWRPSRRRIIHPSIVKLRPFEKLSISVSLNSGPRNACSITYSRRLVCPAVDRQPIAQPHAVPAVASSRLYPYLLKGGMLEQSRIHDTIQATPPPYKGSLISFCAGANSLVERRLPRARLAKSVPGRSAMPRSARLVCVWGRSAAQDRAGQCDTGHHPQVDQAAQLVDNVGSPNDAKAMTLYSSDERRKPR